MIKIMTVNDGVIVNKELKLESFGDGTLKCFIGDDSTEDSIYSQIKNTKNSIEVTWCYDSDSELFALCCLVDEIREINNSQAINLIMPYIPHARQDRHVSGRLFTLKSFAKIINSLNFNSVSVFDPHSDVSTALIDRCHISYPGFFKPDVVYMFPDNGAAKKYTASPLAPKNYIVGNKKRNAEGRIESYELMNFIDGTKEVWIKDDICSYGGTFVAAAKALREKGVEKICLLISHCENNIHKGDVFKYIDEVYTTDSLAFDPHPQITVYYSFRK